MAAQLWLKQYDAQVPHHLQYPAVSVVQLWADTVRRYPHHPCTIFKGNRLTYQEMDALSDRLAAGLAGLGVKKGDRVGLFLPNIPQFICAYFAILKLGAVVVAINPLFVGREIEFQVNDAGVETLLTLDTLAPKIQEIRSQMKLRTLIVTEVDDMLVGRTGSSEVHRAGSPAYIDLITRHAPSERPVVEVTSDDVALLQYTGGTTGTPKGAVVLHRNLVANTVQFHAWLCCAVDGQEVVLAAIPLYHVYGMVLGMLYAMYSGAALALVPNPRDMQDLLATIVQHRASIFPGVPTLYNAINNYPDVQARKYNLSSIKACISGSAPLMRETKEKFEALTGGKLIEGYGLSEAPTATHCNPVYGENHTGSIGLPLPDVDCRIVSLEDGITDLPVGEIGELVVRSPQVMKEYYNMPAETENALRQGWLFTGDIACQDTDGYFYLVDRKKELIKPGGFSVWPREVEEVISAHPKVLDVAVAGVPDAYRGETVKAWVVLKPGQVSREEEIRAWCKVLMAPFKVPTQVEFRNELPKTTVGKILRRELVRQHCATAQGEHIT